MTAARPSRQLIIHQVGELRATPNGNRYLECESNLGSVIVRGSSSNMRNIQSLRRNPVSCDVVTLGVPCAVGEHAWYVPEDAELYFLVR